MPLKRGKRSVAAAERRQLRGEAIRVAGSPAPGPAAEAAASSSTVAPSTVPLVEPVAERAAPVVLELQSKAAPCFRRPRVESVAGSPAPVERKRRVRRDLPRPVASEAASSAAKTAPKVEPKVEPKKENCAITKRGAVIDLDDIFGLKEL
jgi:hypothetical protein